MHDQGSPLRSEICSLIESTPQLRASERIEFFNDYVKILALSEVPLKVRRPVRPDTKGDA